VSPLGPDDARSCAGGEGAPRLAGSDVGVIGLLCVFIGLALLVELYWVVHHRELPALAGVSPIARLFRIYGAADRGYYDAVTPFALALETLNVFVTQLLNGWLIYAILRRRAYRYALQLTLGSYLSYSVVLYFWTNHLDGYACMRVRDASSYWLFYLPNLPWLFGYLYLAVDAARAISLRFRAR
jgi:cholestenol delta-isomerase